MARRRKLVLFPKEKPESTNINIQIQYFGTCLGLFGLRDKDSSCYRLFIELVKTTKVKNPISSQELAYKLNLTRGTVVHHLNRLMDSGIVRVMDNRYFLIDPSLEKVVIQLNNELEELFSNLKEIAVKLDKQL